MALAFLDRWFDRLHKPGLNPHAEPRSTEPEDAESQFSLGQNFEAGVGADEAQAVHWYAKAAEGGHRVAQFNLALMYVQGKGLPRNEAAAVMWLRRAAELGHGGAQYHLGVRLHRASKGGRDVDASESRIEAFKWLQLAVAQSCEGAEAAREYVLLGMTREEADEGARRAVSFGNGQTKTVEASLNLGTPG
jgi:TPR repeat protein